MTLRGSVASFPLETIVQLLAATAKTGQLEVRSGGESGTLGFAEGRLVSAVSGDDAGDPALGAVFTISDGDFEFVPWGDPPDSNLAGDLNQLLDRAVVQRDKIVADRQVISDDRVRFALSDRAAAQGEVRLSAEQWRALLAVNGERDLPAIAAQLGIGRLATLSMLADLVRGGIIEVREAPPGPAPGAGPSGGGGGGVEGTPSFTAAPPARDWGATRADAVTAPFVGPATPEITEPVTVIPPAPEPEPVVAEAPAAAPDPEPAVAAAWETPPPIPPREERVWDEPQKTDSDTAAAEARPWDAPAAARPWDAPATEPRPWDAQATETPAWDATASETPAWDAPASETPVWDAPAEPAPAAPSWDAPVEQTRSWQPPAAPTETERDWGLPAQDWERTASSPADAWPAPAAAEPATSDAQPADPTIDERLSALSGLFGTTPAAPERSVWSPEAQRPETFADPVVEPVAAPEPIAPPVEQPKKKGGLFGGLFKKEEKQDDLRSETSPAAVAPVQQDGTRAARLAAFANALLDEFNSGQYGKGRVDDRIANLLMRVDEQADPIDRPLPIVADRIDVAALERANMSERQVAPYLALLVSQIYADAEHAFGKDKAKRGFKTVQTAVVGDASSLGTDLRLPKV